MKLSKVNNQYQILVDNRKFVKDTVTICFGTEKIEVVEQEIDLIFDAMTLDAGKGTIRVSSGVFKSLQLDMENNERND